MRQLADLLNDAAVASEHYDFDFTMVRGLGYYTGPIFETVISEPNLGSISGGGRYDNLIGMFRRQSLPTTGTSFGIERIIDLMDELELYPPHLGGTLVQALVTVFNEETRRESARIGVQAAARGRHQYRGLPGQAQAGAATRPCRQEGDSHRRHCRSR